MDTREAGERGAGVLWLCANARGWPGIGVAQTTNE